MVLFSEAARHQFNGLRKFVLGFLQSGLLRGYLLDEVRLADEAAGRLIEKEAA